MSTPGAMRLEVRPLVPERFVDLDTVMRAKGCSVAKGCYCMYYRVSGGGANESAHHSASERNRLAMKAIVDAGTVTGLLGYVGDQPVGWVSLGPRSDYAKLERSPVMKPVDDHEVWSIVCFVVPSQHRGKGVAKALLKAATTYAAAHGATELEAYPVDTDLGPSTQSWFGTRTMFAEAGFVEVARRRPQRPIMRLALGG